MIHFEGTESFSQPVDFLFAKLTDAGFLAHCLPDAEVSKASPDEAEWRIRPKLAFIAGALDTVAKVTERTANSAAKYQLATKGVGSGSIVDATMNFETTPEGGANVRWSGDITTLSGLLKLAPKGLIQATAQKVIADVWSAIRAKLV